uniref:Tyrosine-protein phosphatase domain-containing protein n=1 Tax=Anisakis simplex TaxID=6269 RepID=A0A0M3K3K7_ANISI
LKLNVPPETDYIHANWMHMEGCERRYIATQGPLDSTIGDFWRMIYQESIATIVMLCKIIESGKTKCSQYWPEKPGTKLRFSILTIENQALSTERKFPVYNLKVSKGDGDKNMLKVRLLHMSEWPDRAVPTSGYAVLRLIRMIPTVKDIVVEMRKQRCYSVQNEAQYIFIHTTALDYIRVKMPTVKAFVEDFHKKVNASNIVG